MSECPSCVELLVIETESHPSYASPRVPLNIPDSPFEKWFTRMQFRFRIFDISAKASPDQVVLLRDVEPFQKEVRRPLGVLDMNDPKSSLPRRAMVAIVFLESFDGVELGS